MTDMNILARSIETLNSTVSQKFSGIEDRIAAAEKRLGNIVIPAKSRQANIEYPRSMRADGVHGAETSAADLEHAAIGRFVRTGDGSSLASLGAEGSGMELTAGMSVGSDPDGGYTVVPVLSGVIQRRTFDISPLGRLARRETIDTGDSFEEPIDPSDIGAEWVGEKSERPPLDTARLRYLKVPVNEIYTNQPVTQRLLDDGRFDIGGWLEGKISDKFARTEGAAYINGNGIEKPQGLLFRPTSPDTDGDRDYFTIQHINTGVGGGFALANAGTGVSPADVLIDTVYSLRAPYRPNARWLMNMATAGVVRKLKDSEGRFVWADARDGQPATLLGFPVEFDEEMPDIDVDSRSIAFGDFQQAYIIVDKPGVRLLTDPYTMKPHVLFYAYRRVGGQVQNGEAVKVVRFAASG
ncbi:phage major capsid protein [Mesorhizobium sp. DCY119]|uniref:phage major capsid protein n=1 Tax=Mesorhizobium sp. DCY119 TaxID=2108445 RepID=UPI0013C4B9F4|nr:phage major capsid protein [Mesorhizobium sp. DCY119]